MRALGLPGVLSLALLAGTPAVAYGELGWVADPPIVCYATHYAYRPFSIYCPYPVVTYGLPYGYPYVPYLGLGTFYVSGRPRILRYRPGILPYVSPEPRARREGDRYYLERARREEALPADALGLIRRLLRVEPAEGGVYLVRWTGAEEKLESLEIQALDGNGQVLRTRTLERAPFRGLFEPPEGTAAVAVTIRQKDGVTLAARLPIEEFRKLAARDP